MKKLGLREVESLAQRPTAAKEQSWDNNYPKSQAPYLYQTCKVLSLSAFYR